MRADRAPGDARQRVAEHHALLAVQALELVQHDPLPHLRIGRLAVREPTGVVNDQWRVGFDGRLVVAQPGVGAVADVVVQALGQQLVGARDLGGPVGSRLAIAARELVLEKRLARRFGGIDPSWLFLSRSNKTGYLV